LDLYKDLSELRKRQAVLKKIGTEVTMVAAIGDRFALSALTLAFEERNLVGAVTTEEEAVAAIKKHRPNLLFCTERLEQGYGISLIKRVEQADRSIKTLLLLERTSEAVVEEALSAGCDGIVNIQTIGEEDAEFPDALHTVLKGGICYPPSIRRISEINARRKGLSSVDLGLSLRETQVLQGVCKGETNKEIAASLFLSPETIKVCIQTILVKLDARDRTHAAVMAIQRGFAPE
jgi:DNA-binding NarL/FixJ family response regulator